MSDEIREGIADGRWFVQGEAVTDNVSGSRSKAGGNGCGYLLVSRRKELFDGY